MKDVCFLFTEIVLRHIPRDMQITMSDHNSFLLNVNTDMIKVIGDYLITCSNDNGSGQGPGP